MHVLVIPDSFKGSLSAREVAQVMYGVLMSIFPKATCTLLPFSDGGEGALDVLKDSISGQIINCQTVNAIGKRLVPHIFCLKMETVPGLNSHNLLVLLNYMPMNAIRL